MITCKSFSISIRGRAEDLASVRSRLLAHLASGSLSQQQSADLVTAVSELLALVIASPDDRPAQISIDGVELGASVRVTVTWQGASFTPISPDPSPFAPPEATHRFLSESYVDRWNYAQLQGRSQVVLEKHR